MNKESNRWEVLEHLGALVEKSLVVVDGDVIPRYRMLETTRLFALERLIESGETESARRLHRDHYLALAEDCERSLLFGETRRHLARLDVERDNLFLALAWAPRADDAAPGLRLAAAMNSYWLMRAMPARGAEVTRVALERPGAKVPSPERCRALVTAGWMSMWAGAHDEAVRDLAEALELARGFADPRLLCLVLTRFAHVYLHHDELETAARLASEAVNVARPQESSIELGYALMLRAHVHASRGEWQAAQSLYLEALELRERMNNPSGMVSVYVSLAELLIRQDCAAAAKSHIDRALALLPRADSHYEALSLIGLTAEWAAAMGHGELAVLLEIAEAKQFEQAGFKFHSKVRESEHLKRARLALSTDLLEHLDAAGRALTYEQAIQRVRALLSDGAPL